MKILSESALFTSLFNRSIFDTNHSISRYLDDGRLTSEDRMSFDLNYKRIIDEAVSKIIKDYADESQVYGIHSRSTGIGLVLDWRPDKYKRDETNQGFIVTILPIKKFHNWKGDTKHILVEQIKEWAHNVLSYERKGYKLDESEGTIETITSIYDDDKFPVLRIIFMEGKYWDSTIGTFIEVE